MKNAFWEEFLKTGSVLDYLNYCNNTFAKENEQREVYDRRVDNKREQCW